jgi:hypothetical protein
MVSSLNDKESLTVSVSFLIRVSVITSVSGKISEVSVISCAKMKKEKPTRTIKVLMKIASEDIPYNYIQNKSITIKHQGLKSR